MGGKTHTNSLSISLFLIANRIVCLEVDFACNNLIDRLRVSFERFGKTISSWSTFGLDAQMIYVEAESEHLRFTGIFV